MTDTLVCLPLFPLNTVLFPDGPLPLRVFETRYLDMISRCMKQESGFGVVLIRSGSESGEAQIAEVGTIARVNDWYQGSDGILGITAIGTQRFRVQGMDRQQDGLYIGHLTLLPPEPQLMLPPDYASMAALLEAVLDDLGKLYQQIERRLDDATWVGHRFAEILPMPGDDKQHCLELDDPLARLNFLRPMLQSMRPQRPQ